MLRPALMFVLIVLLGLAFLAPGHSQETKKEEKKKEEPPAKLKGYLPQFFGKLGLSAEQKQKIYKIRADVKAKLDDLDKQKNKIRAEEKEALEKVLTPDQFKQLKALRTGEKGDK